MILYHGTDLKSAEDILENGIDVYRGNVNRDFGPGFYMTNDKNNAIRWAKKKALFRNGTPAVVSLDFDTDKAEPFIEKFSQDLRWGRFVINNRAGLDYVLAMSFKEHNLDRKYNITCGKIADEEVVKCTIDLKKNLVQLTTLNRIAPNSDALQYVLHTVFSTSFVKVIGYGKY